MAATRWQYHRTASFEALAALGEDGWELVGVTASEAEETFYLKRPFPSIREEITASQRERALAAAAKEAGR
jgi:hypothetical protein